MWPPTVPTRASRASRRDLSVGSTFRSSCRHSAWRGRADGHRGRHRAHQSTRLRPRIPLGCRPGVVRRLRALLLRVQCLREFGVLVAHRSARRGTRRRTAPRRVTMRDAVVVDSIGRILAPTVLAFDYAYMNALGQQLGSAVADLRLNTGGSIVVRAPLRRAQFGRRALPDMTAPQRVKGVLRGGAQGALARAMDLFGSGTATGYTLCQPVTRDLSLADPVRAGRRLACTPNSPTWT